MRAIDTVFFDLDGTLADTAPDLAFALNTVLQENGFDPLAKDCPACSRWVRYPSFFRILIVQLSIPEKQH